MELISAIIQNLDTANRFARAVIDSPAGSLMDILNITLNNVAGGHVGFPVATTEDGNQSSDESFGGFKRIISGGMRLSLRNVATPASQDARFGIVARVRGEKPTVTSEGNSDHAFVVNEDLFV